ncbi:MAG TPA: HAD family hydrolase [Solirubrobacteraceae bacterium]|nr:HAD family hydrolase [Solirubrobacteraceae bacterium]
MTIAILDIDGTLVDTNYHHALAWFRALRSFDITVPIWRIHRHLGMGGDQIIGAVCGEETEQRLGDALRDAEGEQYDQLIGEVQTVDRARELLGTLRDLGHSTVLASSAKGGEVEHYLDLLEARETVDAWTTSEDVQSTKPAPDLVHAALAKAGQGEDATAVMVGDTPWDIEAARKAGVATLAVVTGGFSAQELRDAGAWDVFESVAELESRLEETPLGQGR